MISYTTQGIELNPILIMIYFSDAEIDHLINEDYPYYDLTSLSVRLGSKITRLAFSTREETVICCTEEVLKIFEKFKITPTLISFSGERLEKDIKFLEGEGLAQNIHSICRTVTNLMGYASGIATRMQNMLDRARSVAPEITIATNRKSIPFTKKVSVKAVWTGGGQIHRLGLSDTILIFDNHIKFVGGIEKLAAKLQDIRKRASNKNIVIEVKNIEDALYIADKDINLLQLDNLSAKDVKGLVKEIRKKSPGLKIAASGNIAETNVIDYATTGVDMLITSYPYYGPPSDFKVTIEPIYDY